ncbi:MAG: hypothetical protein DME22_14180 [Verrucomicrobia bacterium]|nr:MAG: hypothetical protein DME22_14180 [Verrucomicrobiota bacterium]PYK02777.1 MAG: hypothetical protein DME23_00980 [Verrucomicrobiota bacterium]
MKGRYQKLVLILLGVAGAALLFGVLLRSREPAYQGKRLSAWLSDLARTPYPESGSGRAAEAIRAIGTNAVPYLVKNLKSKDPRFMERIILWTRKQTLVRPPLRLASERRHAACDALFILGDKAKGAIPIITALLDDKDLSGDAFFALFAIGTNSIPVLREACRDGKRYIRTQAAWLLGKLSSGNRGFTTS